MRRRHHQIGINGEKLDGLWNVLELRASNRAHLMTSLLAKRSFGLLGDADAPGKGTGLHALCNVDLQAMHLAAAAE